MGTGKKGSARFAMKDRTRWSIWLEFRECKELGRGNFRVNGREREEVIKWLREVEKRKKEEERKKKVYARGQVRG